MADMEMVSETELDILGLLEGTFGDKTVRDASPIQAGLLLGPMSYDLYDLMQLVRCALTHPL